MLCSHDWRLSCGREGCLHANLSFCCERIGCATVVNIALVLQAGKFFFWWINLTVSCATLAYLGMAMVCLTPNLQMGALPLRTVVSEELL